MFSIGPVVYSGDKFGDGIYPIVMSDISCNGWEKSLLECNHANYEAVTCLRTDIVGIRCFDGISYIMLLLYSSCMVIL